MPENTKEKKLKIYKFASEYNLATETLVEFLNEKGYKVKSHMSALTDEMIADINLKFKKDIEKAEKHYKKISEFNKKRSDKTETGEEAAGQAETVEASGEQQKAEVHEEEKYKSTEEIKSNNGEESSTSETSEEVISEEIKEESKVEEEGSYQTQTEKDLKNKKTGLRVVGKMDLGADKRKPIQEKPEVKKDAPAGAVKPAATTAAEDEEAKKKKKKKKLKAKKKAEVGPEEIIKAKKKRKAKKQEVDKKEVEAAIKRTLMSMDESGVGDRASARKKKRREKQEIQDRIDEEKLAVSLTTIKVTEFIAVNEMANLMNVSVSEVIQKCIGLGLMVSINQRLDTETITLVADEFGFEVEFQEEFTAEVLEDTVDEEETLKYRPPVVTIMGHVDHGKTSLLDYIRKANVVAGEAGGITQHIGAYRVQLDDGKYITFLDTPGHEAFTAMRARGASITDIVILIVAADDAVMPQTIEAINHAQAASVPIIIAINKIDKPNSNIDKIKQQLADRNVLVEDWGGKYQCVEVSAKKGLNIDVLLEKVALEAELLELKANPDRNARGTVVESQLDKGRGITATVLVQKGSLKIGDIFVAGNYHGRVRAMFDERNKKVDEAGPSTPVLVLGFEGTPQAGDSLIVLDTEREAREVAIKRQQLKREQDQRQIKLITLDEIASQISQGGYKELPLVVKGDVDGSVEALADSLMKLSNKEVAVKVIHRGVGAISEGDVLLAAASHAIIIGFHVRPNINARKLAEAEKVDIRLYNVIYDAINEVKSALEGMLSPVLSEEMVASVEVRETFKVPKVGTIAGCYVLEGKITRTSRIRLVRDGVVVYEGDLSQLRRFKDDVKEVDAGYECGINIANFNDIKVGDIIEAYKIIETKKKLE